MIITAKFDELPNLYNSNLNLKYAMIFSVKQESDQVLFCHVRPQQWQWEYCFSDIDKVIIRFAGRDIIADSSIMIYLSNDLNELKLKHKHLATDWIHWRREYIEKQNDLLNKFEKNLKF